MSFSVYFENSAKSENSTKQFSLTGLTPYSCVLKDGTSISNPTIILQVSEADFLTLKNKNVAYISELSRYYFVADWVRDGRLTVCRLNIDVLASFWDAIKLQSYYVSRSASSNNINIVDTQFPATSQARATYVSSASNPFQVGAGNSYGVFVVGAIQKGGGLSGCVSYYLMSYLSFISLMTKLFNVSTYGTIGTYGDNNDTLTDDLTKLLTHPLEYIQSITWYPFTIADFTSAGFVSSGQYGITLGYNTLTLSSYVYPFDDSVLYKQFTNIVYLTIPKHPNAASATYLNLAPFAEYRLTFYPFGAFNIDPEYLNGSSNIYMCYTIDLETGRAILNVGTAYSGTNSATYKITNPFLTTSAQMGVQIPTSTIETYLPDMGLLGTSAIIGLGTGLFDGFVSKQKESFAKAEIPENASTLDRALTTIGNVGTNIASAGLELIGTLGNDISAFLKSSGIGSAILQATSSPSFGGAQGMRSLYTKQDVILCAWFKYRANTDNTHFGTPLCAVTTLSTLSGFTLCQNAVADIFTATFAEKRKIENFLNTGFYIET